MTAHEFLPESESIVLGPRNPREWELSFRDDSGQDVTVVLPLDQLTEMDAEFTGVAEAVESLHRRCQGCGELVRKVDINQHRVTNSRTVDYCLRCDHLRDRYDILLEDHEQYRLPELADSLAETEGCE